MTDTMTAASARGITAGPPKLDSLAHVSLPCRDMAEGKRFYVGVLGGTIRVDHPQFAAISLAGSEIGIGTEGCTFIQPGAEYPHIAAGNARLNDLPAWADPFMGLDAPELPPI